MPNEKLEKYGTSEHGNYTVIDTIGVPHSYCITEKHVAYASDFRCGRLDEDAIKAAERSGAKCGHSGCRLKYKDHEKALLVKCLAPLDGEPGSELHKYLNEHKVHAQEDGYVGFAFMDASNAT